MSSSSLSRWEVLTEVILIIEFFRSSVQRRNKWKLFHLWHQNCCFQKQLLNTEISTSEKNFFYFDVIWPVLIVMSTYLIVNNLPKPTESFHLGQIINLLQWKTIQKTVNNNCLVRYSKGGWVFGLPVECFMCGLDPQ